MSIKNIIRKIFLISTFILPPVSAFAVPGDFDADGRADLSVALVEKSFQRTAWATRLSSGATPLFWTFNVPADALVSMRYHTGDPRYYPGVVFVRSADKPLEWYVKNGVNNNVGFTWGLPGDIIPNQSDFDCDGREDPTVVRNQNGVLNWYTYQTATGTVSHNVFGAAGDTPFTTDSKNDCTADIAVLRNNFFWYIRDPKSADFSTQQWGVNSDIPLVPSDLDNDGLVDYVISRRSNHPYGTPIKGSQTAYVLHGNGKTQAIYLGFDSSIPQVGKFAGDRFSGFAWSQRDTGWSAIREDNGNVNVFQFGIAANAIIRPDGTVVQPSSDGAYPAAAVPVPEAPTSPSGPIATCRTTFTNGWLLKPAAQDTGGTRLGKPLILYTRNFPSSSCLNVLASNGTVIGKYGKFSSNRFYSGYGCGSGFSASQFAQKALAASGSKNITIQDPSSGVCWGSGPADGRTDRR